MPYDRDWFAFWQRWVQAWLAALAGEYASGRVLTLTLAPVSSVLFLSVTPILILLSDTSPALP